MLPVDFMDKVVRSDYRSGHSNVSPFIDRDPLPFILILHLHLIFVVRAAWKQPAGNVSVSGGRDVSVAPHLRGFVVFVLFYVFLRPFVHMQTAKKQQQNNKKPEANFCRIHCFTVFVHFINFSVHVSNLNPIRITLALAL